MKKIKILGKEIGVNTILVTLTVAVTALAIGTLFFNPYTPRTVNPPAPPTEASKESESEGEDTTVLPPDYPEEFMIDKENYFDYQPGLECSAFSSAYILRFFGEEAEGLKLFEEYPGKIGNSGVSPRGIVTFFTERGYNIDFIQENTVEDLKVFISKGVPVIAFIHVEVPYSSPHNTHYLPVIGYDDENFYFAESLEEYANCKDEVGLPYNRKTKISDFEILWKDIDNAFQQPLFVISKEE